jgi:RNA polymerase sigma factor (sigma-70 family)
MQWTDTSVERLVRAAECGDERAWNAIVQRYAGIIWAVARAHRLSDADAADAAQATWMRLVQSLGRLRQPAALPGWIATTARRECLRIIRHGENVASGELPEIADEPDLAGALVAGERADVLARALARLSHSDQALLRLLTADPALSYKDIAETLGMPIGSIGPTRMRALARLRHEVERLGPAAEALR